jgi:hypothetical protein
VKLRLEETPLTNQEDVRYNQDEGSSGMGKAGFDWECLAQVYIGVGFSSGVNCIVA